MSLEKGGKKKESVLLWSKKINHKLFHLIGLLELNSIGTRVNTFFFCFIMTQNHTIAFTNHTPNTQPKSSVQRKVSKVAC